MDYVYKVCIPSPLSATSSLICANLIVSPGTIILQDVVRSGTVAPTSPSLASSGNVCTLPPGFAGRMREVVSEGQREALALSREILPKFSEFDTRQIAFNDNLIPVLRIVRIN